MGLEAETLSVRRAGRRVIAGLSFVLGEGELLILRGPNGAGKSTLLRAIAGLTPLAGGRLTLALRGQPAEIEDHVAWAGHLDAVKPQLTVDENIRFWAGMAGADPAPAMARFRLSEIADQPAAACSAGQKRRLGLARLMLGERALWLLDEPTVSLDAATTRTVAEVIGEQLARGGMALVATHIDLGLPAARVLDLTPVAQAEAAASDPFLSADFG